MILVTRIVLQIYIVFSKQLNCIIEYYFTLYHWEYFLSRFRLAEYLGWSSEELMGRSVFEFYHALDNLALDKCFKCRKYSLLFYSILYLFSKMIIRLLIKIFF